MKKTLLIIRTLTFGATLAQAQNCSKIFISEYVEGSGSDKALELYNPTSSPINLAGYSIQRFSNGDATNAGGILDLTGTIAAHSTFVIVHGSGITYTPTAQDPTVSAGFIAMATLEADAYDHGYPNPTAMNGNDAIGLFNGAIMIDLMGKIGDAGMVSGQSWSDAFPYDGSAGAWWTKDQTLTRKSSVMQGISINPDPFIVTTEWDSLPKDTWTGLGTHTCDCPLGLNEYVSTISFAVYPNPNSTGTLIVSSSEEIASIEVINMVGQIVLSTEIAGAIKSTSISTLNLTKGMYTVRLRFANNSVAQSNLSIQ